MDAGKILIQMKGSFMLKKLLVLLSLGIISLNAVEKINIKTVKKGLLCLSFDDSHYDEWLAQLQLFEKYQAHVTFFYFHELDAPAIASMKKLREKGHSIGLHSIHHRIATDISEIGAEAYIREELQPQIDQMKAAGLSPEYFAYPRSKRNADTERMLAKLFRHCRGAIQPYPAQRGYRIAEQPQAFIALDKIADTFTLGGNGVGERYESTVENLDSALQKAADENRLLVLYSHGISADAKGVDIRTDLLEHILSKAKQLGIKIVSMDELP